MHNLTSAPYVKKAESATIERSRESSLHQSDMVDTANRIEGLFERAAQKLAPIVCPRPVQEQNGTDSRGYSTTLFSELNESRRRIESSLDALATLLDGVELP